MTEIDATGSNARSLTRKEAEAASKGIESGIRTDVYHQPRRSATYLENIVRQRTFERLPAIEADLTSDEISIFVLIKDESL
ncbi:hypothetical protein HN018_08870 [Lichenicola cladoniae]|uniref:Uncharacterized protein n=1 Tax=Lichenicola cladoniae TaxID=1484109 RepID=A0A6M8HG14_9PROT|nr:hypothetical protein [Lichenicola cladoniae]NPD68359.1 hypothetical protein [Acetobacteraceae bacterium]QKE88642.1 hypothetical protein HN018_08870 [Lichenicola cladoniae]